VRNAKENYKCKGKRVENCRSQKIKGVEENEKMV